MGLCVGCSLAAQSILNYWTIFIMLPWANEAWALSISILIVLLFSLRLI